MLTGGVFTASGLSELHKSYSAAHLQPQTKPVWLVHQVHRAYRRCVVVRYSGEMYLPSWAIVSSDMTVIVNILILNIAHHNI